MGKKVVMQFGTGVREIFLLYYVNYWFEYFKHFKGESKNALFSLKSHIWFGAILKPFLVMESEKSVSISTVIGKERVRSTLIFFYIQKILNQNWLRWVQPFDSTYVHSTRKHFEEKSSCHTTE